MKMKNIYKLKSTLGSGLIILFLLMCSPLLFISCNTDETQTVVNFTNLVMAEEFDVDGPPDPAMWRYDIGTGDNGWGNSELQYYTDIPDNIIVEGGVLKITAREDQFEGSIYTSARINTQGLFEQQYGRIEARMKLPWGQGLWPAFWLLGSNIDEVSWPQCGEIDIMENAGSQPTVVSGAVHGPGYNAGEAVTKKYDLVNDRFDTDFHIFGIEWGPGYINYYVDDVLYNQITPEDVPGEWVFDNGPFFIILNVAVGGTFDGPPNEDTVFPQTMYVDYIRIYD
ncbi:MAG: glycoside hydrolase family 16 protein [Flavobacteriaceae bacterium]|nr:glycoside hydrolase family 16 protein [Flavobacteriaceae bacterium]